MSKSIVLTPLELIFPPPNLKPTYIDSTFGGAELDSRGV